MMNEYTYWMAFANAEHIYTRRKNEILAMVYTNNRSIADFFVDEQTWSSDYGLNSDEISILLQEKEKLNNYSFIVEDLLEQGYRMVPIFSQEYPMSLKKNLKFNAPVLLYTYGNIELLNKHCTAIVGSRKASDTSLEFTTNVATKAVADNSVVVSGYAKGVDRQALEAAVSCGGSSIIVLPQGITTFGSGIRSLYKEIVAGHILIISTFKPQTGWSKGLAMARNQYIYGLADTIFAAESDSKGGTYSGVVDGLKKKRVVYVRKPNLEEKNANNLLISLGARAVDMFGNEVIANTDTEVKTNERRYVPIEENIMTLLAEGEYTVKSLAKNILGDDSRKSQEVIRKYLRVNKIEPINNSRPLRYTSRDNPTLFNCDE